MTQRPENTNAGEVVRVYTDGIFDLFHFGHAKALQKARALNPNTYLIVGVCNDQVTREHKGPTVMTSAERAESVRMCKWVDEVIEDAPWVLDEEFITKHQIDKVAHGAEEGYDESCYKWAKDHGKFVTFERTPSISTSDLIMRILRDYDGYLSRELHRGYTRQDLNISLLKEKQIEYGEKLHNLLDSPTGTHSIVDYLKSLGHTLEDLSGRFVDPIGNLSSEADTTNV